MTDQVTHITPIDDPLDNLPSKPDIKLEFKKPKESNVTFKRKPDCELVFRIHGKSVDNSVANAIRRTLMLDIPVYGFHRSLVTIEKNKTIYNDDEIYNILETLPVYDIDNKHDLEKPEEYLSTDTLRSLFSTFLPEKTSNVKEMEEKSVTPIENKDNKKHLNIELNIRVKNNSKEIMRVTTHHCILTINGKEVNSYSTNPSISLLKLKPGNELQLKATAIMGIAKMQANWDATNVSSYRKSAEDDYEIKFRSIGQLKPKVILSKTCTILSKKLENLSEFVKTLEVKDEKKIEIKLFNETDTIGNLVATALQKNKSVEKAGYNKPNDLISEVVIACVLTDDAKKTPIDVIIKVLKYLRNVFDDLNSQIST